MFGSVKRLIPGLKALLDLLYPPFCLQCQAPVKRERTASQVIFCSFCWGTIRSLEAPCCPTCAAPFPSPAALSHSPDHRCNECRKNPPPFVRAVTPFLYEGVLATAIQLLKYKKQNGLAPPLADFLVSRLRSLEIDLVIAVPLHFKRLRSREFNQSLLLADRIADALSLPFSVDAMERVRETLPQVGLSKKERKRNIDRAFSVSRPDQVQDQRILLVDDVYTTGATLREGARTLLRAGAKEVTVAALARML